MPVSEKRKLQQLTFDQQNTSKYSLKFNRHTDAEIIAHIEKVKATGEKFNAYIRRLIQRDMTDPE